MQSASVNILPETAARGPQKAPVTDRDSQGGRARRHDDDGNALSFPALMERRGQTARPASEPSVPAAGEHTAPGARLDGLQSEAKPQTAAATTGQDLKPQDAPAPPIAAGATAVATATGTAAVALTPVLAGMAPETAAPAGPIDLSDTAKALTTGKTPALSGTGVSTDTANATAASNNSVAAQANPALPAAAAGTQGADQAAGVVAEPATPTPAGPSGTVLTIEELEIQTTTSSKADRLMPAPTTPSPVAGAKESAAAVAGAPEPTASELEAVAKARGSYLRQPIVSESQLVSNSLKETTVAVGSGQAASAEGVAAADLPSASKAAATDAAPADLSGEADGPVPVTAAPEAEPNLDHEPAPSPQDSEPLPQDSAPAPATGPAPQAEAAPAATARPVIQTGLGGEAATARLVRQQVAHAVGQRLDTVTANEKITIKLNPESLGQIDLSFEAKEDRLLVVMSASTPEAEKALQENLKELTDRITERSSRYSQVEIRVDVKDGTDPRQDGKQDRQDQKRENSRQDGGQGRQSGQGQQERQARDAQRAWENAMSWHLADQAAGREG